MLNECQAFLVHGGTLGFRVFGYQILLVCGYIFILIVFSLTSDILSQRKEEGRENNFLSRVSCFPPGKGKGAQCRCRARLATPATAAPAPAFIDFLRCSGRCSPLVPAWARVSDGVVLETGQWPRWTQQLPCLRCLLLSRDQATHRQCATSDHQSDVISARHKGDD